MEEQAKEKVIERGQVLFRGAQRFECVEMAPYENKRGEVYPIAVLVSACAECGRPIRVRHKIQYAVFEPVRRCDLHKAPLVSVKRKGAR